jgi:EmrB/QacA subfamily drug resistance transporter
MNDLRYAIRLAVIYSLVWFIDLLDASTLNVALPHIAAVFHVDATSAEWTIIGFLLAMTLGMSISGWLGDNFGTRKIFLFSQFLYIASSMGCGFSDNLSQLIFFRIFQGLSGGLVIPLGMATLLRTMPAQHWAKTASSMNMVTLVAPALGPLFAGYITELMGWRWLFFIKLPLSLICLVLSFSWVRKSFERHASRFDWLGFLFSGLSLTLLLLVFSEVGRPVISAPLLTTLFVVGLLSAAAFVLVEKKSRSPLIPLALFKLPLFTWGNIIQSAANIIFLGASFIIALYLQNGLRLSITTTGWVMAAITPGMLLMQPLVGKFYNRLGPLPFIIPGLILLALTMFAFIFVTPETSPLILALLIFLEGAASSLVQTANVMSIFSDIPHKLKGAGSSLYSLFKQIAASLGVALSTMALSIGMRFKGIAPESAGPSQLLPLFHASFILLGVIPLLALICAFFIDNQRALKKIKGPEGLHTETELGAE